MSETESPTFRCAIVHGGMIGAKGFFADNEKATTFTKKVDNGELVMMTPRRPRNTRQHRLMWALYAKLADNMDFECTARDIHEYIKRKIGHVKEVGGEVIGLPTNFAAMPQDEFQAYFERVRAYILREVWPHLTAKALQDEIEDVLR